MAFLGVAGIGTIIAGQLVTVVAGQGIGSRAGRELGEALSLGRWRGVEANPHHAGEVGVAASFLGSQLVTMVGGPGLTCRRPGTHLEEAMRVGSWPPPPPAPAPRIPPPPPPNTRHSSSGNDAATCKAAAGGAGEGEVLNLPLVPQVHKA